jgi:hypothetical protein
MEILLLASISQVVLNCQLSTRDRLSTRLVFSVCNLSPDLIENTTSKNSSLVACLFFAAERCLSSRYQAMSVFVSHHVTIFSLYIIYFHRTLSLPRHWLGTDACCIYNCFYFYHRVREFRFSFMNQLPLHIGGIPTNVILGIYSTHTFL